MSELTQYLVCDVELKVSGPHQKTVAAWAASALRRIADRLERHEFDDGHHDVTDNTGRPIGSVYFDFSEGYESDEP